ncbi:hypothetical protein [Pedobacter nutrimenti]|uniref:Uncharacterized protein n=1 Tax=Pedobacter nutrimenti TaxID=1241337 RepID=A0A318UJ04_9SPHI|nr:hypothetical protein [Pedobacter nutrimenti]PYF75078.1 hypothetical protein B0O44_103525 [Pedobacter nutrimenti]
MKKRHFKWIWYSLLGGFVIYKMFWFFSSVKKFGESDGPMPYVGNIVYKELFNNIDSTSTKWKGIIQPFTYRNPVNMVKYEEKFDLFIYNIGKTKAVSLKQLLNVEDKSVAQSGGIVYTKMSPSLYSFLIQSGKPDPIAKLFLSIKGDSLKTIVQNDTLVSYNFKLKNFSLRYKENGDRDIVGEVEGILAPKIPYSLVIYKKQDAVYLLTMSPKDRKTVMDPMLLTNLVLNKEKN